MSSDMSKCVHFSVLLDITGVLKDSPSQKHQKCIYYLWMENGIGGGRWSPNVQQYGQTFLFYRY